MNHNHLEIRIGLHHHYIIYNVKRIDHVIPTNRLEAAGRLIPHLKKQESHLGLEGDVLINSGICSRRHR
jgi:hypothetical protein